MLIVSLGRTLSRLMQLGVLYVGQRNEESMRGEVVTIRKQIGA